MNKKDNKKEENINLNLYGEFIPTEFKWIDLDEQKKRAKYLSNITNK